MVIIFRFHIWMILCALWCELFNIEDDILLNKICVLVYIV